MKIISGMWEEDRFINFVWEYLKENKIALDILYIELNNLLLIYYIWKQLYNIHLKNINYSFFQELLFYYKLSITLFLQKGHN